MATDLLERVRAEVDARLAELRPAVAEYERLEGASDALLARSPGVRSLVGAHAPRAGSTARAATRTADTPRATAKPRVAKARGTAKGRAAAKGRPAAQPASARMGAGEQAIVAALEHGSHTVGELGIVTARSGAEIRASVRRLLAAGRVVRAKRDGRTAYALQGLA